ncbi:putative ribonuclease H-like domain-containing protein [Tanacetum coccineum]|uniref:Ribonuclease H-like domain-containing protein n=1 Tax=Tanacetum coccineum TaxID=301880 RepID=A0ABQ5FUI1_9ASTR
MTENIKLLINFVWKFLGTVRFGNDHIAAILGYGDLKWGNITIARVYFVEDLDGVDLLEGNRTTNLYSVNLYDMASASPICLMPVPLLQSHGYGINDYPTSTLTPSTTLPKMISSPVYQSLNMLKNIFAPLVRKEKAKEPLTHPNQTKDETPEVIKNFLKNIYVRLQAPVIIVRTDNGTGFKNLALKEYFDSVGIKHETSAAKTPQQNGVIERRNRTLVEVARTMLIFSHAPLFLWAEAIATACYTQINDREDIGKLGAKGDIGFFIGYSANSVAYRVYNRRTKKIMETMNVTFDEISTMAFEQNSSKPGLQNILFEPLHNEYLGGQPLEAPRTVPSAPVIQNLQAPTASMTIQDSAPTPTNSSNTPNSSHNVDEKSQHHAQLQGNHSPLPTASATDNVPNVMFEGDLFVNPFATPSTESAESSTQNVDPSNIHTFYQPYPYDYQWTKDHPLELVIGEPSRLVLTRNQLKTDGDMCIYALTGSIMEPKTIKEALTDPAWIESMQKELHQFIRLDVWELVASPDGIKPLTLKWLFM